MNRTLRLLAPCLLLMATAGLAAQPPATLYTWRNVVIGGGGFSPNVIFSPAERGLAYLRTDVGGVYRWDSKQHRWGPARRFDLGGQLLRDREHRARS